MSKIKHYNNLRFIIKALSIIKINNKLQFKTNRIYNINNNKYSINNLSKLCSNSKNIYNKNK